MAPDGAVLELAGVYASYGRVEVLRNVSFAIAPGQSVAVLGANGAGKTTLLRAISGLMVQRRGAITFQGKTISTLPPHEIVRLGVGHVPEGKRLFGPMTVDENIEIGALPLLARGRGGEAAEARDLVYSLFPILRDRGKQVANTLSGGEQQMLAIGRALMSRPQMLLLDEPTVGLAPKVNEQLFSSLARLKEMKIVILIAEQVIRLACDLADDVIVLHLGQIAMRGPPRDVRDDPKLKQLYLGGT